MDRSRAGGCRRIARGKRYAASRSAATIGDHPHRLQRHDLSAPGREVLQALVTFAPGSSFPRHSHPGEEIIFVTEGTLEYQLEGRGWVAVKAGEVLFVPDGAVHAARNAGRVPAAELATYVIERGKPLVTLAE